MGIAILDNGYGNLGNLATYVERAFGTRPKISRSREDLEGSKILVLPGVGNFAAISQGVEGLGELVLRRIERGEPLLAICLGMQLLFEESEEGPGRGLGILGGRVKRLPRAWGLRVPRIGWAPLIIRRPLHPWSELEGHHHYYAHSYYADPGERASVVGISLHGELEVPSLLVLGSLVATQFHPERSGASGDAFAEALKIYWRA